VTWKFSPASYENLSRGRVASRRRRRPAPAGSAADLLVPATRLRHVRASRRNGVDQSFLTQGSDRAPGCGASDLIRLDKLTFGGDAGVWRVLAGQDPALDDRRYLPVGRYRAERVDPLSWHMINFRYCRPWSCGVIRCYTYRYVSASRGQYSRFPGDAAGALQRLEEEPARPCSRASELPRPPAEPRQAQAQPGRSAVPTGSSEKFLSAAFAAPIIASPYSTL
jgi:hypothetical protein